MITSKEGHEERDPAQDVGPGEPPVPEAPAQEVDGHSGVDRHGQQHKESCLGRKDK